MSQILREIGDIARGLDSISNLEFLQLDLTRGQYLYLVRIAVHPGIIQEELAEMLLIDRTTTARAVQRLAERGMIEKRKRADNQKINCLYLTQRGKERYQVVFNEHVYSEQSSTSGLTATEIRQLERLLKRVTANVQSDWRDVKNGRIRPY
ncbi:MarR family transcriptional regulator [Weissella diestrammenae]|uniref:MarR family transcriptional regulator n=1 Tax=Weissella diestrammenae TaxID=1162633 RepID=A0A7G9T3S3_9LACO|nr:MarR family transcriptional regulator [Weissella diestrammenae]MCM0582730.1 MarR family transcriptional regulator [Weissella diestrammenae]QNN74748.1 MarR family transcriptional regulator [Weissella diestrammenae]